MCNAACLDFGRGKLNKELVEGKKVLEVGSLNVNGSLREYVQSLHPISYLGVDVVPGEGVDYICPAELMVEAFGERKFDLVICTEMLEHVQDWRLAIKNLKLVCVVGGTILLTTRSKGFPKHDFPYDYWRFEPADMKEIFSDCTSVVVEPDFTMPGVFVLATRGEMILDLELYGVAGV